MDKAKLSLDEYTRKTEDNPCYIAYDMLDCREGDDILNQGETVLDRNDKQKDFPSLNGLENQYNLVKVVFDPNFEKRLVNLAHVVGHTSNSEHSGDFTTASQSFLP